MSSRWRRLSSAGGFSLYLLPPMLSAVTPLLVFPAVTHVYGAQGLGAIGIAQSVGVAASVIGELGWAVVGPQKIASMSAKERALYVRVASTTRLIALIVVLPLCVAVVSLLTPAFAFEAAVVSAGSALAGLSLGWAWIGANRPSRMLLLESIPRVLFSVTAAGLILAGGSLSTYGFALILAALFSLIAGVLDFQAHDRSLVVRASTLRSAYREQALITGSRVVTAGYTALPVSLIALVSPAAVPLFTAVDRLARMALSVMAALPNRLQSWVGSSGSLEITRSRSRRQLIINSGAGLIAGVAFALAAPAAAHVVFSATVTLEPGLAWISGAMVAVICASRGLGLSLVAAGRASWLLPASVVACIVGVGAVLGFGYIVGAVGAVIGVLLGEAAGAVCQVLALRSKRQ